MTVAVVACVSHPLIHVLRSLCCLFSQTHFGLQKHYNNLLICLLYGQSCIEMIDISSFVRVWIWRHEKASGVFWKGLRHKHLSKHLCLVLQLLTKKNKQTTTTTEIVVICLPIYPQFTSQLQIKLLVLFVFSSKNTVDAFRKAKGWFSSLCRVSTLYTKQACTFLSPFNFC